VSELEAAWAGLAQPLLLAVAKSAAMQGPSALARLRAGRRRRRLAYQRLEVAVLRVRLRIEALFLGRQALGRPTNLQAALGRGLSLAFTLLDRVSVDLVEVQAALFEVQDLAPKPTAEAGGAVVTALADLLDSIDPGWQHPWRRRDARAQGRVARRGYDEALGRFMRLSDADAAPRWRDRRRARRTTRTEASSNPTPGHQAIPV
jgi:hypothetical protein